MGKKDKIIHPKVRGTEMVFHTISLPVSLIEDLKILKDSYQEAWKEDEGERERVTYEKIFERLLSRSGLGHVDPDVYEEFVKAKSSRKELPAVVTRATRGVIGEFYSRMQTSGSSAAQEALKEIAAAEEHLAEDVRSGYSSPATAVDQKQSQEPVISPEDPADSTEGKVRNNGYYFEKDGVRLEAFLGTKGAAFYAVFKGKETGIGPMIYQHHFKFFNSDGVELTKEQAEKISERIKANNSE